MDLNFAVIFEESVKIHINNLKRESESGHQFLHICKIFPVEVALVLLFPSKLRVHTLLVHITHSHLVVQFTSKWKHQNI